jgi:hypothetical protein
MRTIGSYLPDYRCLVCGEDVPKTVISSLDIYDTSKDNYFVRFDESENLKGMYKANMEKSYQIEKEKMKSELNQVANQEFKVILENQIPQKIDRELKTSLEAFDSFVHFFRQDFQLGSPQPRYAVTSPCMKSALKNVRALGKPQYVMDSGNLKIVRLIGKLDESKFTQTFPFVSKNFKLDFLDSSKDSMELEFAHFSKFPINREYLRSLESGGNRDIFG